MRHITRHINTITKLRLWFIVKFNDWPCYRVTYNDFERTRPLHYAEAKGCAEVFGGKLWLDYEYADKLINQL